MPVMSIMKTGLISALAIGLSVSPALAARGRHPHFRRAHAATLDLTRVNLHPKTNLNRPLRAPTYGADKIPTVESFRLAPGGWTGSVGYLAPGVNPVPTDDLNQASATQYRPGEKTVGAAIGIKF